MDRLMINNIVAVATSEVSTVDIEAGDASMPVMAEDGAFMDPMMEMGMTEVKQPLLASWPFVLGISGAVLLVSVALGALLARRKIKKGIEIYED